MLEGAQMTLTPTPIVTRCPPVNLWLENVADHTHDVSTILVTVTSVARECWVAGTEARLIVGREAELGGRLIAGRRESSHIASIGSIAVGVGRVWCVYDPRKILNNA